MKKFALLLIFFFSFLLSNLQQPSTVQAWCAPFTTCSCKDAFGMEFVGASPANNTGSNTESINFYLKTLQLNAVGKTYQVYIEVIKPSGTEWIPINDMSPTSLEEIFEFEILRSKYPDVFDATNGNYEKRILMKEKDGDTFCNLWKYRSFPTPVAATGSACNDTFSGTRNSCNADGGCQQGFKCSQTESNWGCVTDATCGAAEVEEPEPQEPPPANPTKPQDPGEPAPVAPEQPTVTKDLQCGDKVDVYEPQRCGCPQAGNGLKPIGAQGYCCGWAHNAKCYGSVENYLAAQRVTNGDTTVTPPPEGPVTGTPETGGDATGGDDETGSGGGGGFDIFAGPTSADFKDLNPLRGQPQLNSPGGIISRVLTFAFPLAGLILFTMLVWGGFEMLVGATGKGIDAGKQRVTNAIIGFFALFISYWIFQIVEVILGLQIL